MGHRVSFRIVGRLVSQILLMAGLITCGRANPGSGDLLFDMQQIQVGHTTASVLILDQDDDGWLDLLVIGGGHLTEFRGNGSGGFNLHGKIPAGEQPVDLAVGDLNQDGRPDLVIANHDTDYLTLFFGRAGGFGSGSSERLSIEVSPHPHAVEVADLDGDGHSDIVVDDRDRERLMVYRGLGNGTFIPGVPIVVGGDPYRGMVLVDLDGDGRLDVVTPNPRHIAIQKGTGRGRFSPGPSLESGFVPPFNAAVADFNGDEIPDIAAGSGEGRGRCMVWFGKKDHSFVQDPNAPYVIADGPTRLNTADVDGDGLDDILVTSYIGNELAIGTGDREGFHFQRIRLEGNPWDIAAGDLNRDGHQDLVVAHDGADYVTLLTGK